MVGTRFRHADVNGHYDAIVVGSGISGLATAALLALDGRRVVVLEQHYVAGGCTHVFRRAGYEWDVGLHYVGDVQRRNGALRRTLDHITAGALEWAALPEVFNRIAIGDHIVDIHAGVDNFKRHLAAEFPSAADILDDYVSLVFAANGSARGFWAEKALGDVSGVAGTGDPFRRYAADTTYDTLRRLTDDDELIAVLTGNYGDLMCPPKSSSFAMHAMVARHYIDGASYPVGGAGQIAATIAPLIEAAGGQVITAAPVRRIDVTDGRVVGVTLADGTQVQAPLVVSSAGVHVTYGRLLDRSLASLPIVDGPDAVVHPADCVTALNVGIAASNDELGLHAANIWAHPGTDHDGAYDAYRADPASHEIPFHFITVPSAKDPTWDARYPGRTTLSICSLTSWDLWAPFAGRGAADPEYLALKARITEETWEATLRFHPQLRGRIDHAELATPLSFNRYLGRTHGNFMGIRHSPDRYDQAWLRPATPIDGLFLTGQDISSDGVAGATMSAVTTASAVLGRDVLADIVAAPHPISTAP